MDTMPESAFLTNMDEIELVEFADARSVVAGDSVRHRARGSCLVLARIGDTLMVEQHATSA
jgi:hypothetical protein